MKFSNYFLPTLKEDPSDSDIASHSLCIRAGLIRKIASGIYTFLPLGYKILKKIENIIREEMNNAGAIEILMPVVQPAEIWQQSNRWYEYGPEMFKLADRSDREFCLGPTHEELITSMAGDDIYSYKDLPVNLYQIQVKFRDEIRPRYGLLRAREFIMKDAYSFGASEEELDMDYEKMYQAYSKIIERIGLKYRVVEADTGLIGGKFSHEFMIIAKSGEETICYCNQCSYAANIDNAKFILKDDHKNDSSSSDNKIEEVKEVYTPGVKTIEELAPFLKLPSCKIIKTMISKSTDGSISAFLLSGDRTLNISKAEKLLKTELELITEDNNFLKLPIGFLGPHELNKEITIYGDYSVKDKINMSAGANKKDYHYSNINQGRDYSVKEWGDFSYPVDGDLCINCQKELEYEKGIEVGHIFKLGSKYSSTLNGRFLDKDGKLKPYVMGCYGIGVTRLMAAAIEQNHDEKGIIWPESITPFTVILIATNMNDNKIKEAADNAYEMILKNKIQVLYDDRDISAGIKFKDADLIGISVKIIFGKKFIQNETVDIEYRKDASKTEIKSSELENFVKNL
ncbi:MAG: proline--tRNA ligase [Candidatus Humimicrobiaceae bacterium]